MATIVVASEDGGLVATLKSIADAIKNCQVRWIAEIPPVAEQCIDEQTALVVLHADEFTDEECLKACLGGIESNFRHVPRLVICDEFDAQRSLQFLRMGVTDCLARPLDLRRTAFLIESLTLRSRHTARPCGATADGELRFEGLCAAASPAMHRVLEQARRVAPKSVPVLLSGETGVGKTHLAKLIHDLSPRAERPFVAINCGALPSNLVESELFGHKKGAFTSADEERVGRFADVQDGTLFLDEVDSLPLDVQVKLLRALDERLFEPVGSNESLPLRARMIAATNRALGEVVGTGQFRSDLYYRLNVVELAVPPLRERRAEIRRLALQFISELSTRHEIPVPRISPAIWEALEDHSWPGNVRELHNAIEHALTLGDGEELRVDDLPPGIRSLAEGSELSSNRRAEASPAACRQSSQRSLADARQDGEVRRLAEVLGDCKNNRSQAARELGISRTALYKKLVAYNML